MTRVTGACVCSRPVWAELVSLSLLRSLVLPALPTAYAVGFILAALRG
jgi:hypothetical protein